MVPPAMPARDPRSIFAPPLAGGLSRDPALDGKEPAQLLGDRLGHALAVRLDVAPERWSDAGGACHKRGLRCPSGRRAKPPRLIIPRFPPALRPTRDTLVQLRSPTPLHQL